MNQEDAKKLKKEKKKKDREKSAVEGGLSLMILL
jgi:hypothetical protein